MLDNKELKDFKMSLTEYINYGMDNALNQRWMKELENASARVHIDRLEQLKLNIQAEAMKLFGTEDKTLTDSIKEAYNERYDINNYIVQKGLGIGFDVASIDQDKLDKFISKPWASDGRNFSNRLWQSKEQMVNNLYNQIVRLSLGGSLKDAIDSMTRYVGREIKNKKYAAQRLIQTEMSYFTSEAQKESYKELGLDKYEIVATLDNKTSSICQEMDGKVYDMKAYQSGITAPPFHPNCRSTTCPYFDDEFTVGEMRKAKDLEGKTYKVPATMNYREWKEEQEKIKNSISIPKEYDVNKHKKEIEHANLIHNELGGNIEMLVEDGKTVTADMLWNDKLWEIKAVTSETSIDNAIRHGLKQIAENPGGIVLNIDKCKLNDKDIEKYIKDRLNRTNIDLKKLNVILVKDKSIYKQLEIKKEEMAPSTKTGANSISSHKDTTTEPIKSQLKNEGKDDKIYIRKAEVVEGQDLVGKVKYKGLLKPKFRGDPNKLYAIDEIVEKQGFNGLPTIINSEAELKKLTNDDTLLGERTIRAKDEDLFNQYCNDLLNDRFYINCAVGGAQYGQGMYFCGDYTKGKISADKWQHEIDQYAGKAPFKKTYWLTLQKNIKSIEDNKIKQEYFKKLIGKDELSREEKIIFDRFTGRTTILTKRMVSEWFDDIKEKYKQEGKLEQLLELQKSMRKDLGVMAAEMGYDMIEAKGHGTTGSYNVLLNRTKLIIIDKDIKAETIENIFGGNGIEK